MTTLTDARFEALRALGYTGTTNDMLLQWLQFNGATSPCLPDAWLEYLNSIEILGAIGQRNDRWYQLLGLAGYTGQLNDRELAFWEGGGAEFILPDSILNETTVVSVGNAIGSAITAWNTIFDRTSDFDYATNSGLPNISLASYNGKRAIQYVADGWMRPLVEQNPPGIFAAFIVIYIDDTDTFQIIDNARTQAPGQTYQLGIDSGEIFIRTDPLNDGNWTTLSLPILECHQVVYLSFEGPDSHLHVFNHLGDSSVDGALDFVNLSYDTLGSDEVALNGFSGRIGELWSYQNTLLPEAAIHNILEVLFAKWDIAPTLRFNENGHRFVGLNFTGWDDTGLAAADRLETRVPVDDAEYVEVIVNGLPAIQRVGNTALGNLWSNISQVLNNNNHSMFIVFRSDNELGSQQHLLDGGRGAGGSSGRVIAVQNSDDISYSMRPVANTGPIASGPVGVVDNDVHLMYYERQNGNDCLTRFDGQPSYVATNMPGASAVYRPLAMFGDTDGNRPFQGTICEVVFFNPRVSNFDLLQEYERFLMGKWGVTLALEPLTYLGTALTDGSIPLTHTE